MQIGDQYLDSREIEERIDELNLEIEDYMDMHDCEDSSELDHADHPDFAELDNELNAWNEFKQEMDNGEWYHGQTFIHVDEFVEYCQESLADTGVIPADIPHYIVIDWEATADNIRADYTEGEIEGESYLTRA